MALFKDGKTIKLLERTIKPSSLTRKEREHFKENK